MSRVQLVNPEDQINISTSLRYLTPEDAKAILKCNKRNRSIFESYVNRYRTDMLTGRYEFNGSTIVFGADGLLLDGQHRMLALAGCKPGTRIPFLIVNGVPSDTQMTMDQGRARTTGSQLGIRGIKSPNNVAAGVKIYLAWQTDLIFRGSHAINSKITKSTVEEFVFANLPRIERIGTYSTFIFRSSGKPSVAYAAALEFDSINPGRTRSFFDQLYNGVIGDAQGNPITTLDKRLSREKGTKVDPVDQLGYFILTWNNWIRVHKTSRLRSGDWNSKNFPKPVRA